MAAPSSSPRHDGVDLAARAFSGAVAMFLVQPPADLWWAAWVAPLPWLFVVRDGVGDALHPWRTLWCAGFLHWLLAIHWLRLPHPATSIGWLLLSAYLALELPLFIWAARRLVDRHGWPLVVAAPVAWVGCEHLRGSLLGGFTLGGLGHTQWRFTTLIQIADVAGAEGVGGVVMLGAAAVVTAAGIGRADVAARRASGQALSAALLLAAVLVYGRWRIDTAPADPRSLDVLLVQGSIDTELKHDPEAAGRVLEEYDGLTRTALEGAPRPDLVVWPETMWRWPVIDIDPAYVLPDDVVDRVVGPRRASGATAPPPDAIESEAGRQARCRAILEQDRIDPLAAHARRYGTTWLVGVDRQEVSTRGRHDTLHYNTALFLDAGGVPRGRYDKMFPVMFGETVPLADRLPFLYALTPLAAGLTAGDAPLSVTVAGLRVAPTICYETALPGAIRAVVGRLAGAGERPDILVNLTNDGWFWGSSELDMHLACGIFRAVEVRTPLAIAANTGFSAAIDGCGRLLARGPRRATGTVRCRLHPDGRRSPWLAVGPVPTATCGGMVVFLLGLRLLEALLHPPGQRRHTTLTSARTLPTTTGGSDGLQDR